MAAYDGDGLRDQLLALERALAARVPGGVPGGLIALVADDFLEFGRSGRVWTRDSIRDLLDGPPDASLGSWEDVAVAELADGVALVTYRTAATNRSSIWVRREGRWLIRFHQGTPAGS